MFEPALREDELWIGEMRGISLGGQALLVVRGEAGFRVYRDRCPHQGYPLSAGTLQANVLTCRLHHHTFDACSGQGINPPAPCLRQLDARVEGGQLLVELTPVAAPRSG